MEDADEQEENFSDGYTSDSCERLDGRVSKNKIMVDGDHTEFDDQKTLHSALERRKIDSIVTDLSQYVLSISCITY